MTDIRATARRVRKSPSFWLGLTIAILLYAVWQSDQDRPLVVRNAQIEFCNTVTKPASADAASRDRDIAIFAKAAATARRASADESLDKEVRQRELNTARTYEQVVTRAKRREADATRRANIPCEERFPKP